MLKRVLLFPVLMGAACLVAALYGAVHNQISYTVAPGYFHEFKFLQFQFPLEAWTRLGASWIGVLASWWMGLVLGVPVYVAALFVRGDAFVRAFLQAVVIVVIVTLLAGLGALAVGFLIIGPNSLPWFMEGWQVQDPVAFARAGQMHNFSYMGGLIGAVAGMAWVIRAIFLSRDEDSEAAP